MLVATGNKLNNKEVTFSVKLYPGQNFKATLGWQAQNIKINTWPESSQFDVPNPTGELRPGMFADVGKGIENKVDIFCPLNQGDTLV